MRTKLLALALCLALCLPASALGDRSYNRLSGLTAAEDGGILATDSFNKVVWLIQDGSATRYAGTIGAADAAGEPVGVYLDSTAENAFFMEPWDIAPFLDGYAVTDTAANVVRYIVNGRVQTLSGSGTAGSSNGAGDAASFNRPTGLAVGPDGSLYVADTGNGSIRRIEKNGMVSTVVSGLTAPTGLCWSGDALYVAETGRCRICRVEGGAATAFAGQAETALEENEFEGGYADGPVETARFDHPQGIAAGPDGTLYVSDTGNSAVRMIAGGRVYTLARSASDTLMPASPRGLLVRDGTLYVADTFAGDILTIPLTQKTYADVSDQWFAAAVRAMTERGIMGGMSETEFMPSAPLSRAMFTTMLSRVHQIADGSAIIDGGSTLSDIEEGSWYAAGTRWAIDLGIITGSNGLFLPAANISREEIAAMLYRYAQGQGLTANGSGSSPESFSDAEEISSWAADAMRWACENGILNGADGKLNPRSPATRAEASALLLNFMNVCSL